MSSEPELIKTYKDEIGRMGIDCDIRFDHVTRLLYSTDASIYQIEPLGVAFPRRAVDLPPLVETAARLDIPILARGSGSSLAGQAIGRALILDCSRYLKAIVSIDPENLTAVVEPGVILSDFNQVIKRYNLQFGPDPASAERATLGGCIANNAAGAHSLIYGMTADHLASAEVILSDGSTEEWKEHSIDETVRLSQLGTRQAAIYHAALQIRTDYQADIRTHWPRTWRRASGYSVNYLLPWSPSQPPQWSRGSEEWIKKTGLPVPYPPVEKGMLNLAPLLAGSEGTLAVIQRAQIRLTPCLANTILGVVPYPSLGAACDAVPALLELAPSAVELIPPTLIELARSVPAYASQLGFLNGISRGKWAGATLLVVEFSGEDVRQLKGMITRLGSDVLVAETPTDQKQVWAVRKVGLGILMSRPGAIKPVAFIEDLAVPVEHLGQFVREMEKILAAHGTRGDFYAHASAGCLHIRPLIDLKSPGGATSLREIAHQAVTLALSLGGTVSGEHSDGLARGEWLEDEFGSQVMAAFRLLKKASDPQGILNPGKIIDPPQMDLNMRYSSGYHAAAWEPILKFNGAGAYGLQDAIEMCNGAGVCRKSDGVMCPSFQASQEEMHSTRGRSNLLRLLISGRFPTSQLGEEAVREALDLCLACKGCKAECPSGVDVAKLKYEFTNHYYESHRRPLRDYLFGNIGEVARLAQPVSWLVNLILGNRVFSGLGERFLGLTRLRPYPRFAHRPLSALAAPLTKPSSLDRESVLFLNDSFTEYFYPKAGLAAVRTLKACGCQVKVLPVLGAGRTLISKGFLKAAREHLERLVEVIQQMDPSGSLPVVGVEPSEVYTLRDELASLLPGDSAAAGLSSRAFMIDEFVVRPAESSSVPRLPQLSKPAPAQVLLHGHCYQKSQPPAADGYPIGVNATVAMLKAAGYTVDVIEAGCCGMAGAFGYEAEHYQFSKRIAEMKLLPAVRKAEPGRIVAASGISCQAQIAEGAGREVFHPIVLVDRLLK